MSDTTTIQVSRESVRLLRLIGSVRAVEENSDRAPPIGDIVLALACEEITRAGLSKAAGKRRKRNRT